MMLHERAGHPTTDIREISERLCAVEQEMLHLHAENERLKAMINDLYGSGDRKSMNYPFPRRTLPTR